MADWVQYIETRDAADYEKNIVTFADAGYDVIVTVGFNMTEATYAIALKFPNVKFIAIDQTLSKDEMHPDWPLPNLVDLYYKEDHSGFLVGALAAMMSSTHKIGAVCGPDSVPPVWRYGEGYRSGAGYADGRFGTQTEVFVIYHNNVDFSMAFFDPDWGAEMAKGLIADGVDVIFGCGAETGNGVTDEMEKRIWARVLEIEAMGDPEELSDKGWFERYFEEAMAAYCQEISDGSLPKVGLNTFEIPEEEDTLLKEVVESKIEPCWSRIDEIKRFKESRDQARIKDVLLEVCEKSKDEEENLIHIIKEALLAGATMGEIAGMMRIAYGVPYDPLGMINNLCVRRGTLDVTVT